MNFQQPNETSTATGDRITELTDIIFDIAAIRSRLNVATADQFDLWISTNATNTKPNAATAEWAPRLNDGDQFRIHPTDPGYCVDNCTFYIAISCATGSVRGSYEITASTSDVLEVLSVQAPSAELAHIAAGGAKFYQVYLALATNFSFVVEPCIGEVDFYVSAAYNRPDAKNSFASSTEHDRADVFTYRADPSTLPYNSLFFGVYTPALDTAVDSTFQVRAAYMSALEATEPLVSNKVLTPVALEAGEVRFLFFPATSAVGTPPEQLIYSVVWAEETDTRAVLYTQCGVQASLGLTGHAWQNYTGVPASAASSGYAVSVGGLQDTSYQFNVMVTDPSPLAAGSPTTTYKIVTARPNGAAGNQGGSTSNKVILGIGIPLAIFVVGLLAFLWIKNRRLSKELSIEMHDVPAAALRKAARGPTSAAADADTTPADRAKSFHKLLQDETDSSDAYVAPSRVPTAVDEL